MTKRRAVALLSAAVLTVLVVMAVPFTRQAVLRGAGWTLVAEDPLAKADVIVVSTDSTSDLGGLLAAADMVRAGLASRVVLFQRPVTPGMAELARRGVSLPNLDDSLIQLLHTLGVQDVRLIPAVAAGTTAEGALLKSWCAANSVRSVLFVSNPDHSRRSRRVLARALRAQGVHVIVRYTPYVFFDPDNWWRSRSGQRIFIEESEKLLLDWLAHPLNP
jgi:hypothetical protein